MRAAVVEELGQAPRVTERADPQRTAGTTLVRITAASINPVDLHISSGGHPAGTPPVPHIPGVEGVGTVVESDSLAVGTRVRVSVPGGFVDGTLAEYVSAPDATCVPLPDALGDDLAAAIGIVGISALVALREEAGLRPGDSVLVLGATGGLGQALVHLARALGAGRVIAAGRNPQRLETLAEHADTLLLDSDPAEFAARLAKAGGPVDVVADLLWGPYASCALPSLLPDGRYVNLGQTAGAEAGIGAALLRHGHLKVTGFSGASLPPARATAAYREVAEFAAQGRLELAIDSYPLAEVGTAWAAQAASPGAKITLRP
ncbi:NADPH:quinone reductase-like Zn-dependent oxidoreductase [Streptacidiphilus sp. MAP12-16]|uniref:quinone oxidoreductase family protein n=1 Tax=Streptacidiphilus sp. MAP12-16 TaxID=3156300 RepID=UPI0035169AAA